MKSLITSLLNLAMVQGSTSARLEPIHTRGPICGMHIGTATRGAFPGR